MLGFVESEGQKTVGAGISPSASLSDQGLCRRRYPERQDVAPALILTVHAVALP